MIENHEFIMAYEIKRETCFWVGFKRIMNLASELGTKKKKILGGIYYSMRENLCIW